MMKCALALSLIIAVGRVLASDGDNSGLLEVRTSIGWGRPAAHSEVYRVIRSAKDWDALWQEFDPRPVVDRPGIAAPVDFANWMLVYIAVPRTAPGSYLSIEYAWDSGKYIEINAVEVRPTGPQCTTIGETGVTSIVALIKRSDLPVYFHVKAADLDCRTPRGASVR